jgi:hypothetical protein
VQRASGIPCALCFRGREIQEQNSGAMRRENAKVRLETTMKTEHFQPVIAGLDPAIDLLRKSLLKLDGCPDQVRA